MPSILPFSPVHLHPYSSLLLPDSTSINKLRIGVHDGLDCTLLLEMRDSSTRKRPVDLHTVDQGRGRDDSISRDFLHDPITGPMSDLAMRA